MLLHVCVIFSICWSSVLAEKNFWGNDICNSDSDCSGLTSCDDTFGCTTSALKVGFVMFGVFLTLCAICTVISCLCRRSFRSTPFVRPHNQYVPHTVTPNQTQWNQNQMGTTTAVYPPHNPYPNQFYANSANPPSYNECLTDPRLNVSPAPTAPYPPAGFGFGQTPPQTHYGKH